MDILESPCYRINKILLTCLGQWPLQRTLYKHLCRFVYACVVISITVPMILRLIEVLGEFGHTMECISILMVQMATCIKFCNYIFNADKMKQILFRIRDDWNSHFYQPHLTTLEKYAMAGKQITQIYTVCMYVTLGTFVLMPMIPKILDNIMPLNETRPLVYPIPVAYGNINMEKYYVIMMLHADCAAFLAITTIVAIDTTYTVYVQHACGIFAALGERLQHLMEPNEHKLKDEFSTVGKEKATYQAVVECVKMHKGAIELVAVNLEKPNEAFRFVVFTLSQFSHIFYNSWPGQKLIDHSERIHRLVYEARWYEASPRSKKLLIFMMMRSIEPCKLTAGKFYDVSFATFSTVIKSSMSYFTLLTSFR